MNNIYTFNCKKCHKIVRINIIGLLFKLKLCSKCFTLILKHNKNFMNEVNITP